MIKTISATNEYGERLEIPLKNPESSGYFIINIEGLGPPKAIVNTVGSITFDGSIFNSSKVGDRNLKITLGVKGVNNDLDTYRLDLYKYFPIQKPITFGIKTTSRDVIIEGYVETHEVVAFSKFTNNEIVLLCPGAYFVDAGDNSAGMQGTRPLFQFPFSNDDLTIPLLIFGDINTEAVVEIDYKGDVETGFVTDMFFSGPVSGTISLYNLSADQAMRIDVAMIESIIGGSLGDGHILTIDSRIGKKRIVVVGGSVEYNVLNALDMTSDWITLFPGVNRMYFLIGSGNANVEVLFTYDVLLEGV